MGGDNLQQSNKVLGINEPNALVDVPASKGGAGNKLLSVYF
jgi:hypothetical protein